MQHAQFYFTKMAALLALLAGAPALAATMAQPHKPDPLLDGGPTSPCAENPDYNPGTDVHGRPVAAADEGAQRVPVPDTIAVPLHSGSQPGRQARHGGPQQAMGDSPYVSIDGKRLDALVNPKPCH